MEKNIVFRDIDNFEDFGTMIMRLNKSGREEILLQEKPNLTLNIFGCTQAPIGILDSTKTVLVQKSFKLKDASLSAIDTVVESRAILDRLARIEKTESYSIPIPPVTLTAAWTGILPPKSGWANAGSIEATSLKKVAEEGIKRVKNLLPDNPGAAVVQKVRESVWGLEIAPNVPAAAAFALEVMGYLSGETEVKIGISRTWLRLQTKSGNIFVR